jgi:hypothetical protein
LMGEVVINPGLVLMAPYFSPSRGAAKRIIMETR